MAAVQTPGTPAPVPAAPPPAAQAPEQGSAPGNDSANLLADPDFAAALRELEGDTGSQPESAPPDGPKTEPAPPPEAEKTEDLSPEWAKLRAHEKRHKARVAEQTATLNAQRAEIEKLKAEAEALRTEHTTWREKAKKTPLEALKLIGWDLASLTQYVANNGEVPQEKLLADMKIQMDEEVKALRQQIEESKKEKETERAQAERMRMEREAGEYEQRVASRIQSVFQAEPAKFPNLARVPPDVVKQKVLDIQIAEYERSQKSLAVSDAMLYAERNLAQVLAWVAGQGPGQAGTVQSVEPVAAKPSQTEAAPIGQRESTVRGHQKVDLDSMTDDERWQRAQKILAGEIEPD